jgi:flavin-dependent thymidylate synthase
MRITLVDFTHDAEYKMIFTKSTRLKMVPSLMNSIYQMSREEIDQELEYMANTIPSSWEFASYSFLIEGVSRAFTHQLVRNRQGSYAQQTMRILDVSGFDYITGPTINNDYRKAVYDTVMTTIQIGYDNLIQDGAAVEDARGLLPTNICTNIVAKFNLRTLSEMMSARSSSRTQGEYRAVVDAMYQAVLNVHPWAHLFLNSKKKQAADTLDAFVQEHGGEHTTDLVKLIDILRKSNG